MSIEDINYLEAWFEAMPRPLPDPVPFRQGETMHNTEESIRKHFEFVKANLTIPVLYEPAMLRLRQLKEWLTKNGYTKEKPQ